MSLIVRIPDALVPLIEKRASAEGKKPEDWIIEVVTRALDESPAPKPETNREQLRAS